MHSNCKDLSFNKWPHFCEMQVCLGTLLFLIVDLIVVVCIIIKEGFFLLASWLTMYVIRMYKSLKSAPGTEWYLKFLCIYEYHYRRRYLSRMEVNSAVPSSWRTWGWLISISRWFSLNMQNQKANCLQKLGTSWPGEQRHGLRNTGTERSCNIQQVWSDSPIPKVSAVKETWQLHCVGWAVYCRRMEKENQKGIVGNTSSFALVVKV